MTITRRDWLKAMASLAPATLAGCGGQTTPALATTLRASPWPQAEALFRRDPLWLGGDAVYSIDLGQGRVLYLFGDTFISTSPQHVRTQSVIVRNSAAIQTGYDPGSAAIRFSWGGQSGAPAALIPHADPARWYWPLHGAMVGPDLLLFLSENVSAPGGLGFQATGWAAAIIGNPDGDPSGWNVNVLPTRSEFGLLAGASVLQWEGYLYAYATPIAQPAAIYLVRWPLATVVSGRLASDQWYTSHGWGPAGTAPIALMRDGQAEFSVFPGVSLAPFVLFQTDGFGAATIAYRTANDPTGDWSDATAFHSPPESTRPGILIYSAKMHPMLVNPGAEFVVSYSTNSTDFQALLTDESLYFPRFLQVTQG